MNDIARSVDARFAAMNPVGWPDPRPNLEPPGEEEYSRLSDPGKYRIIQQRARAWLDTLVEQFGAEVHDRPLSEAPGRYGGYTRVTRLSCPRPNTMTLWVMVREVPGDRGADPLPVVEFAVDARDGVFSTLPRCGCDACDDGSDHLLGELDEVFISLITGTLEIDLRRTGTTVSLHNSGWSSEDESHPDRVTGRYSSRPWL